LRGLSKPNRWRFLVKNSDTEISRWRAPISAAVTAFLGWAGGAGVVSASALGIGLDIEIQFLPNLVVRRKSEIIELRQAPP
jgi:hypothetical protein